MSPVSLFNAFEVLLWLAMGIIVCAWRGSEIPRRQRWMLAVLLFLFAGSDAVELSTGAWWRPWWLLVWKATCLVGFALIGWDVWRNRGQSARPAD